MQTPTFPGPWKQEGPLVGFDIGQPPCHCFLCFLCYICGPPTQSAEKEAMTGRLPNNQNNSITEFAARGPLYRDSLVLFILLMGKTEARTGE